MMFIRQHTQTPRAQQEVPSCRRFEPEPAGGKHAHEMTARKKQNVTLDRSHAFHHAIGTRANLTGGFAPGTAVTEKLPAGAICKNLRCTAVSYSP